MFLKSMTRLLVLKIDEYMRIPMDILIEIDETLHTI